MQAESKNYKGIEYVQLSELPQLQRDRLIHSINPGLFIKIMIDGKVVDQCLQYKDYILWFEKEFKPKVAPAKEVIVQESIQINPNLALNKY